MYFKRIEMHGFKSFAEPVTIEFDKGITCVVGPNGSGKSNISDAIRWVLGEQSPKMLRGGKMEDVIFAGTASRKSRGMAEVTLVIDNSTGILPIEYQEVAITRRMYRSGESEYAINNNQCRMKDIRELLMDTGIGVDGYSLIGQGKISDIISNKTESIREIFEETAGIVSYRSKKAEAERKLASANTNMDRVNDIISEIESRIGSLKEDSEKATEYVELRDRHKELEINITVKNTEDIAEKTKLLSDDLKELEKELNSFGAKRSELEGAILQSKEKLDNFEVMLEEANGKLKEQTANIGRFVNEKNINRERLHSIEKDTLRLTNEIKDIEEKIQGEIESRDKLLEEKQVIDKKHRELEDNLNKEIAKHSESINKKALMTEEIDSKKNDIFTLSNKKSGWVAEKASLDNLADNLERNKIQLIEDKNRGDSDYTVLRQTLEDMTKDEEVLKEKVKALRESQEKLQDAQKDRLEENSKLQRYIQETGVQIGQKTSRKKTIEEMESNYEGYNGGVRFVMKSGLKGIHGVVAELIDVPEGFETALETALGATMQNVVCSDDGIAKEAVNLLKNNRAGRLTFLPIKSIKPKAVMRDEKIESKQGFKGYGVDCVKFDSQYTNIFEYLLGNVVVIDTMENAINISKIGSRGMKYVTLEGEIINTAGAVTGGKYKNKTANILERRSEIAKLAEEIEELSANRRETEKTIEKNAAEAARATKEIEELTKALRDSEIELINKNGQLDIIKKSIEDFKDENIKMENSLNNIEIEKQNARTAMKSLEDKIKEAEETIKELEAFVEKETQNIENMSDELNAAGEDITAARIQVNSCENEKENLDNLVDRIKSSIAQYEEDAELKRRQLENIRLDSKAISEGIGMREEKIAQYTIEKEKLEAYIGEISREKAEVSRIYSESTEAREELNQKTTKLQNQKYEIDIKLARHEGQLDNLKNKLWEDFEVSYAQALAMKSEDFVMSSAVRENRQIKTRIKELGEVNIGAIKEYAQVSERYEFLTEQRADIQKSTDELNQIIGDMDKVIREKFKTSFDQVVEHFESTFVEFFGGGHAKISLDNENDPLNATIEITAQPPGKQLKNINLMSGGEKTMTAIALMFAVLKTKPTPCCILDEVEAALDDHNIHVFANYLKKFDNIQFTLITHQKTTMEHADVMYGVTMPERGISKVFSLKMGDELPS